MKVITADPTGLCFGVKRAITTLEEELRKSPAVYALGSPIHNPQEIARLTEMGLVVVDMPEDVPEGAVSFGDALPYLPGGFLGSCAGALLMGRLSPKLLRRGFGALLLFAGVRLLLR